MPQTTMSDNEQVIHYRTFEEDSYTSSCHFLHNDWFVFCLF